MEPNRPAIAPIEQLRSLEDLDNRPGLGALVGGVNANIFLALGSTGLVTNGGVCDLAEIRSLGFPMFAGNVSASHAYAHIFDFGGPVVVGGLEVRSGDLIHADRHGVETIPPKVADQVSSEAREILQKRRTTHRRTPLRGFFGGKGSRYNSKNGPKLMKTDTFKEDRTRTVTTEHGDLIRRTALHLGLCMVAFLTVFVAGCGSDTKATSDGAANASHVAVVKVSRRNLTTTLEIASEFRPFQEISVYAKVSGYIQKLYIDWGTHVGQGQLLAVLEIPELQQQLELDQAAVRRSGQDLARANEELSRTQSTYNVAHLTYTRLADVQKTRPELVAQEEIDVAEGKDLEANSGVFAAKDSVSGAEQGLLAAKASLEKDKAMYAYARISAPFNGVVTEMDAYTGSLLPAGTSSDKGDEALCRLSQNDLLRLVIPVPERAVASIRLGQPITVNVSALNRTFVGKVVRYSGQIDMDTRTMHTELQLPNPNYEIVPGMYATVKIPLQTDSNALTLPIQAVQPKGTGEGTALIVNSSNRIEERTVKLGIQSANRFEILSGVQESELAVFGEQGQYKPGMLVSPQIVQPSETE
jgi:RND family efflux transporter MFP subunit